MVPGTGSDPERGAAGTRYRAQLQQDRNQATDTRRDPEPAEKKGRA